MPRARQSWLKTVLHLTNCRSNKSFITGLVRAFTFRFRDITTSQRHFRWFVGFANVTPHYLLQVSHKLVSCDFYSLFPGSIFHF
jgi:hypothetical protein